MSHTLGIYTTINADGSVVYAILALNFVPPTAEGVT